MPTLLGRINWSGGRDKEGHRDYRIEWLIQSDSVYDGPTTILSTPALPRVGSFWAFGNDIDNWAFCWPTAKISPLLVTEAQVWWKVQQTFTTKPLSRCQDTSIENPMDEPPKLSGSFVKYARLREKDKDDKPIVSKAFEKLRGSAMEFDDNRPTVRISKNYLTQQLATFAPMIDTLNDATLWGLASRKIKLANASWTQNLYGSCTFYYTVEYEFDINEDGFKREILDEGQKEFKGTDVTDPTHWHIATDAKGRPERVVYHKSPTAANKGRWDGVAGNESYVTVDVYKESNFLQLGVPTVL